MNMKLGLGAALLAASLLVGGTASAATVDLTYDFSSGANQQGYTLSYSTGGVGLAVTGYLYTAPQAINAQAKVYSQNQNGLGVCGGIIYPSDDTCSGNTNQLDGGAGANDNEVLKFTFAEGVSLVSIEFNQNDQNDIFDFFLGEPLVFQFATNTPLPPDRIYTFAQPYPVGTTFGIGIRGNSDEVRIAKLTVRYDDGNVVVPPPIPLPAGMPLMLAGLGAMAFLARRKARKA